MSPTPTPESLIRSVMQGLQGALDIGTNQETIPVPRAWVQSWLDTLGVVLVVRDDPMAPGAVAVVVASGVLGILLGLAGCWLFC
jgi:hypothetical protein